MMSEFSPEPPADEVALSKIVSIQRCVARAREEYTAGPEAFAANQTRQDAAILNLLRGCQQAIDLANHILKTYKLGVPLSSGQSFAQLAEQKIISVDLAQRLRRMVHFRNIAVHQYQAVNEAILQKALATSLADLLEFGDAILTYITQR